MSETKDETKKKEDEAPEVGQMKRGDYMIHVFIENARQLKCPEGNTVDPIIEVTVMNEKKYTTAKDDIGSTGVCTWNEHLFFEPKNVVRSSLIYEYNQQSVEEIEQAKIQIKLLDKGYFKDAMIGAYDFDVAYVYFMKQHSLMHQWLALSNPQSPNFNEVTGYLKISITIAATGDEQVQITEDSSADKSDESIMMPPSIRPEYYQLRFKFFRAEKLPSMDKNLLGKGGSIDAYIICNYLSQKLKTTVLTQKEGGFIDWNQEFCLPIMSSRIVMKLYDEDKISDEIVGSLLFNVKDCIGPKNGKYFWKNIYGSPLGCSGDNTNMMNSNPEVASQWKGRILMQVTAEKTEKPVCISRPLPEEDVLAVTPYLQPHEFEIIAEIGQGISLPAHEKYSVMIKIGDYEMKTGAPLFAENSYNRWSMRFKQATYAAPYRDIYDIGRVYVYLLQGDKPICYWKGEIEEFMDPNPQLKWIELLNDMAIGKVSEPHKSGLVSFKLSVHDKTVDGPINFEQFEAWKKPPTKRLKLQKVRVYLFQCRDLPSADSDGQSDPYIVLWDMTKDVKKTRTIEDNLNPMFFETQELIIESNTIQDMPPFILDIYDWDPGLDGDDFIARSLIPISEAVYSQDDEIPRPKWHSCRLKPNAPECGQILISFSIVIDDFNFKTPLQYMRLRDSVETPEFQVDINILGLRDLQSVGILPVKKAFIVFNLKSLVPPEDGAALENVKTQPSAAGANPTINTLIQFKIPLPKDPLFCPRLQCTVNDYIFRGLNQPMIGSFIVPIGDLIFKLAKERQEETAAIDYILNEIDKIMEDQGIQTYSIQQPPYIETFGEGLDKEEQKSLSLAKKSIKIDDEMKQPLLFEEQQKQSLVQEELKDSMSQRSPSNKRVTPRSMTMSQNNKGKTPTNALKHQTFDKFNSGLKNQLLAEQKDNLDRQKREQEDNRKRDLEEYKKKMSSASAKNVIMAQYELDSRLNVYREVNPPPDSLFQGLGWDDTPEAKRRHYRRFYPDELENIKEVMPTQSPFDQYDVKKGQSRGNSKGWWPFGGKKEDDSGAVTTEQVVGRFKGIITVQSEQDKKDYAERKADLIHNLKLKLNKLSLKKTGKPVELKLEKMDTMEGRQKFELDMVNLGIAHLNITQHLADLESDETLKRLLMAQTKCIVRVYMINAYDLASRDNGSFSDPYLIVSLGNKTYNERQNYITDEPNPEFNKYYDFEATFPGCPPLNINVMDYDDIFGDDSIGKTSIDLEDRFFSPSWQSIKNKPIEFRQLYHPSSSVSQGVVKLWLEIHPTSIPQNEIPIWDVQPKPAEEFEVRVCIFDTLDIKMMDAEGTSDVYFRSFFDSKAQAKETDTHYRCQNGKASFNYRLLFDLKHPRKDYTLTFQAYDRDFFKSNDIIGESMIDLKLPVFDASLTGRPLGVNKIYYEAYLKDKGVELEYKDASTFWLPLKSRDSATGKTTINGKVRVQIDIYPKSMAESNKVGEARQEPNHSPFLPPPVGRLQFSLNPLKMFQQLVGPAMRRKIYCYCCLALCLALCIFFLLFLGALAQEERFSHAIFSYPTGEYESLNKDLRDFLENELGNYREIVIIERGDTQQAMLEYIEKDTKEVGETAFPNYFPVSMLKDMLKQNGMLLPKKEEDL